MEGKARQIGTLPSQDPFGLDASLSKWKLDGKNKRIYEEIAVYSLLIISNILPLYMIAQKDNLVINIIIEKISFLFVFLFMLIGFFLEFFILKRIRKNEK